MKLSIEELKRRKAIRSRAYRQRPEYKAQQAEAQRKWRRENLARRQRTERNGHLRRKYGITVEAYDEMLKRQNGLCAVCQQKRFLVVDHNHTTGKVREWLCQPCNTAIGMLEEQQERFTSAIRYLEVQ